MRARLGRFGVVGLVVLAAAAPAWGSHSAAPATYNGAFADGGAVSFDVSADGSRVTRIMFSLTTPCGTLNLSTPVNDPIVNGAFSHSFGTETFRGTFPASQTAQGAVDSTSCGPSTSYGWSATTTATPAATPTPTPTPTVTP